MTLRSEKIPRSRMRERRFIYNALNGLTLDQVTAAQIDQIKGNTHAQGGVIVDEYDAIEQVSRLGGQSSSSGYLLGTLTVAEKLISLDTPTSLVNFPDTPRANYKLEKIGVIGSNLSLGADYKITIIAEVHSAEVPILSAIFNSKFATSDSFSFDLNVTLPQGTDDVLAKIVSDTTHTPSLSIGMLYGRVR